MPPIAWIISLMAVCALFFYVKRANRNFEHTRRAKELARENARLRQAVFELSMEEHNPKY